MQFSSIRPLNSDSFNLSQYAVLKSDEVTVDNPKGKFVLPSILPEINNTARQMNVDLYDNDEYLNDTPSYVSNNGLSDEWSSVDNDSDDEYTSIESEMYKTRTPSYYNRISTAIENSNNIELTIPKHLFTIKEIKVNPNPTTNSDGAITSLAPTTEIIYDTFKKDQKFIVGFVDSNENNVIIIGVCP